MEDVARGKGAADGTPPWAATSAKMADMAQADDIAQAAGIEQAAGIAQSMVEALADVLSCSRDVIEIAVATFVAGGHLLLEDVPGVGKTTLAKAMSKVMGGETRRIQFTPDMLPGDLTGVSVYSQHTGEFDFHPGPLFANIVIADEVNRANPKAQSAMLEAMGEGQVSVDGATHMLPDPYFVVATQNPIELEGTYPLPEAQLDRFMTCTGFGYPEAGAEAAMLTDDHAFRPLEGLRQVCDVAQTRLIREACRHITLVAPLADYIVALVSQTRSADGVRFGASPRGSLNIAAFARAHALMDGREFVTPDDVQASAVPVLVHRLAMDGVGGAGMSSRQRARAVIESIVQRTAVPRADEVAGARRRRTK